MRHAASGHAANPYPEGAVKVERLAYQGPLVLLRLKDAPSMRSGEDAHFIVAKEYRVTWTDAAGQVRDVTVPRGLLTDLTSVPPVFRGLVGRVGPWLEAAVVHDYLTIAWRVLDGNGTAERRRFADDIMLAAMREARVGWLRMWLIYGAVRVAGLLSYPRTTVPDPVSDHFAAPQALDGAA